MLPQIEVLYEDNHLLVVNKPAGIPTQGAAAGEVSLVQRAKDYLKQRYEKPGNVYLGVVSRLDALVTGVVVFARTSKAAARVAEQFREAEVAKTYWAAVEGRPPTASDQLVHWIRKDDARHRMIVVPPGPAEREKYPDTREARLHYRVLQSLAGNRSVLLVKLETGRKHQIRLQLSTVGHPILGDAKYNAHTPFTEGIALHARRLVLAHPTLKTPLTFLAPLPAAWRTLGMDAESLKQFDNIALP